MDKEHIQMQKHEKKYLNIKKKKKILQKYLTTKKFLADKYNIRSKKDIYNFKKHLKFYNSKIKSSFFKKRIHLNRIKKMIFWRPTINRNLLNSNKLKKKYSLISLTIKPNNFFCTLRSKRHQNKLVLIRNSASYKIKVSKKRLRHTVKKMLFPFFREVYKKIKKTSVIIQIIAPVRVRKIALRTFLQYFKSSIVAIDLKHKKCFNGCRPPKKKRKKRKGFRIFK